MSTSNPDDYPVPDEPGPSGTEPGPAVPGADPMTGDLHPSGTGPSAADPDGDSVTRDADPSETEPEPADPAQSSASGSGTEAAEAELPPAGSRYPQQLQYSAGDGPRADGSPEPGYPAQQLQDSAGDGPRADGSPEPGYPAQQLQDSAADGPRAGGSPEPGYPAPDQQHQQVWEGNPWGAELASPADTAGSPRPYVPVPRPAPADAASIPTPASMRPTAEDRTPGQRNGSVLLAGSRMLSPLIFAGLALVLLLAAGVVGFVVWRNRQPDQPAEPPVTATNAVRGYLYALQNKDSATAIGYLAKKPASTALMTDHVLAVSAKAAPISGITVQSVGPQARTVTASYRLGDHAVHTTFLAHRVGRKFLIDNGFLTIDISTLPAKLPIDLNGVRLKGDKIELLPGSYALSVPNRYLTLRGHAGFIVTGSQDVPAIAVQPVLNDKGQSAFRATVAAAVDRCVKSHLRSDGCGLDLPSTAPDGNKIVDRTVQRQLTGSAASELHALTASPLPGDPLTASASLGSGAVLTRATCELKGKPSGAAKKSKPKVSFSPCVISGSGTALGTPVINMAAGKLKVSWR